MGIMSRRQKLELQPPVQTTFPLSSPITEEISSPSCSSAEDRELERTRPFDFLVKATKQRVEKSQKDATKSPRLSHKHGDGSRLSVGGITKKRRNNQKPVGLNLVTDFSTPPGKAPEETTTAPLVDLNDLKVLSKAREKERLFQKVKTNPKKRQSRSLLQTTDGSQLVDSNRRSFLGLGPGTLVRRPDHGLSPSDRQVMIGLTVPYHESTDRSRELDSAGDQHTPLTPSIIVTPACEEAPWSSSPSPESIRPRATSSIYSQPTPRIEWQDPDIPPVPAIPEESALAKKTADPEWLRTHLAAMTRKNKSHETVLALDSPDRDPFPTGHSDSPQTPRTPLGANSDANRPESQGWWTYLLSPLLTGRSSMWSRKSPMSPGFPPEVQSTTQTTQGPTREWWEKETSCFSPDTPETAATLNWGDEKGFETSRSMGNDEDEATIASKRRTVISSMFPGGPIQGEAAEYYQACAHELFSRKPYFECSNHICSITPPEVVAARFAEVEGANAEAATGDRGLDVSEAEAQTENKDSASVGAPRGLLIDVDSPTEQASKEEEHIKGAPSRASTIFDKEKSLPGTPKVEATREAPLEPAPVHEPTPDPPAPPPPAPEPAPAPAPAPPPPPPQITNNIHQAPPPAIEIPPAPAPVIVDREVPHYIPPFQSNNPFQPPPPEMPREEPVHTAPPAPVPMPQEPPKEWYTAPPVAHDPPQEPDIQKMPLDRGVPPLGIQTQEQHPEPEEQRGLQEASPMTPGFQRAAAGPGAIPLSDVSAPAPAYAQHHRDVPLPQRYDYHSNYVAPEPMSNPMNPAGVIGPAEAQRRRLEQEDAAGRKVGGLWRGRGPFSNKGCFGRPGREGRNRRRWYLLIGALFFIIIVVAIALATTLTKKGDSTPVQSAWVNLTGYPPMPTGIATIAGAENQEEVTSCTSSPNIWSCALPKGDAQTANKPYSAHEPTFRVEIRFRNGTYSNSTTLASRDSMDLHRRDTWTPSPSAPSKADQIFIGNTTDGVSEPFNGEETPFFMTFMSSAHIPSGSFVKRSNSSSSTNTSLSGLIPPPEENSDHTVAAAQMYPLPSSQPVRLYNRGESDEHYGFYTYFDKSIFLSSTGPVTQNPSEGSDADKNGGSNQDNAHIRCTWAQTRFLIQIWTQPSKMNYALVPRGSNGTSTSAKATATSTSSTATSSSSATDYTRPGSFPYPVTITEDRHGGDPEKKSFYCYGLEDAGQHYNVSLAVLQQEYKDKGGKLINPLFNSSPAYGGVDGGTGGCSCKWTNWISTS